MTGCLADAGAVVSCIFMHLPLLSFHRGFLSGQNLLRSLLCCPMSPTQAAAHTGCFCSPPITSIFVARSSIFRIRPRREEADYILPPGGASATLLGQAGAWRRDYSVSLSLAHQDQGYISCFLSPDSVGDSFMQLPWGGCHLSAPFTSFLRFPDHFCLLSTTPQKTGHGGLLHGWARRWKGAQSRGVES